MEEVKKSTGSKNFYLYVFEQVKIGIRPSKICSQLGITKQSLNYYLSSLKRANLIQKIGYGTWEIIKEFDPKEVKKSTKVTNHTILIDISKPDQVRGHAFQFKLKLPKLRNWDKREEIFVKKGIEFKQLTTGMGKIGQKMIFKGRKIWLTDNSIIVYEKSSYMSETAEGSKNYAIYEFKLLINSLERLLGANFSIQGKLLFRISRQHYSLVKNALAKQYNKEGKKLEVYDEGGFWLSIDNSFNLHELETLHPKTADQDNLKVQNFFNGIKKFEGFTPDFIVNSLGKTMETQMHLDQNLKTHFEVLDKIGKAVDKLAEKVEELNKKKDL